MMFDEFSEQCNRAYTQLRNWQSEGLIPPIDITKRPYWIDSILAYLDDAPCFKPPKYIEYLAWKPKEEWLMEHHPNLPYLLTGPNGYIIYRAMMSIAKERENELAGLQDVSRTG